MCVRVIPACGRGYVARDECLRAAIGKHVFGVVFGNAFMMLQRDCVMRRLMARFCGGVLYWG